MPITDPAKNRAHALAWYYANKDRAKAKQAAWYRRNREKALVYAKTWRQNNDRQFRSKTIMWMYGITLDERDAIFEAQGKKCASCGNDNPRHKKGWHVDHDHTTKKVRGILCHHCNISLGHLREDPKLIRALADYIESHQ